MSNHDIDMSNGKVRFSKGIIVLVAGLMLLAILGVLCKKCTSLSKFAEKDEYNLPKNDGLIKKTKELFVDLLAKEDKQDENGHKDIELQHIDSINKFYKALEFTLPYDWSNEAYREDIRLVGIKVNYLSEKDKEFYYNSRLPELLEQQRKEVDKKIFDIKFKNGKISSIELIPSMFKVALTHKPWTGKITGRSCELFPENDYVFLICENSMLPLKKMETTNDIPPNEHYLISKSNTNQPSITYNSQPVDYYKYWQCENSREYPIQFNLNRLNKTDYFRIFYTRNDVLKVLCSDNVQVKIFDNNTGTRLLKDVDAAGKHHYLSEQLNGNTKLLINKKDRDGIWQKYGELQIVMQNPLNDLSYLIQTNHGRERVAIDSCFTDNYTQQILRIMQERTIDTAITNIPLSLDVIFSKSMQKELEDYLNSTLHAYKQDNLEDIEISLTVMNSATGEVLAAPFASTQQASDAFIYNRKNPNLTRRYTGSTFKPLMTLATVLTYPDLLHLDTRGKVSINTQNNTANLLGFPIKNPFAKDNANHWAGNDMKTYLSISDDVYPVALATYALNDYTTNQAGISKRSNIVAEHRCFEIRGTNETWFALGKERKRGNAKDFMFIKVLDELYQVYSNLQDYEDKEMKKLPAYYSWRYLQDTKNETDTVKKMFTQVSPDGINMHYDLWHTRTRENTLRNELASWVLGQGSNEWSNIKIAEAWARMVTKRPVFTTLVSPISPQTDGSLVDSIFLNQFQKDEQSNIFVSNQNKINDTWNSFLDVFKEAQSHKPEHGSNTLSAFNNLVTANHIVNHVRINDITNSADKHLICFSKTGTPSEFPRKDFLSISGRKLNYDIAMFTTALMTENQFDSIKNNNNTANKGIVLVVRIVHTYPANRHHKTGKGIASHNFWSTEARDFYTTARLCKIYDFTKSLFENNNDNQ